MKKRPDDDAITVLSILLILLVIIVSSIFLITILTPHHDSVPHGLVTSAILQSGDSIRLIDDPIGYSSDTDEIAGFTMTSKEGPDQTIGSIQLSVSPLIGDLAIDMDRTSIGFTFNGKETFLTQKKRSPLNPGEWAITSRYGALPFGSANDDDILHAGETFDVLIVLPAPLHRSDHFILTITPYRGMPLPIRRTVPPRITGVTQLPN